MSGHVGFKSLASYWHLIDEDLKRERDNEAAAKRLQSLRDQQQEQQGQQQERLDQPASTETRALEESAVETASENGPSLPNGLRHRSSAARANGEEG